MGRRAEGWKLVWRVGTRYSKRWEDGAVAYVRFTYKSTPYLLSTGEKDQRKAEVACSRLYSDVIQRGAPKANRVALSREPIADLFTRWLASLDGVLDRTTASTYEGYVRTHFLSGFEDLTELADLGRVRAYINRRLKLVLKDSILKELSALRGFLTWCRDEQVFTELPAWVELKAKSLFPAKAKGKRSGAQREKANELSPAQVESFIAALPVLSERTTKGRHFPIRARFLVAYETGLRPATLDEALWTDLETDIDGRMWFVIRDEIDKNRFGRRVPISAVAAEEFERVPHSRSDGLIFGRHDYRVAITKACVKAGIDLRVAPYDFRHARGTHLIDAGAPLTAVAFLHGHTQVTTTNKYVHASDRQAAQWVNARPLPPTPKTPLALPPAPERPAADAPAQMAPPESQTIAEVSRTLNAHATERIVRRTGVEPVQELPRWNLNPSFTNDPRTNKGDGKSRSPQKSAEVGTSRQDSRTLFGNGSKGLSAGPRGLLMGPGSWLDGVLNVLGRELPARAAVLHVASEWAGGAS